MKGPESNVAVLGDIVDTLVTERVDLRFHLLCLEVALHSVGVGVALVVHKAVGLAVELVGII